MSILAVGLALKSAIKSPTNKFILVAVANYADEDNKCWPSQRRLALDTGYTKRTITNSLQWLEDNGYLSREKRSRADGSQSSDIFIINQWGEPPSPPVERTSTGGEPHVGGGGELASTGSEPPSPLIDEPSNNHQLEPSNNQWPKDYAEQFWKSYPRKIGKQSALKALSRLNKKPPVEWLSFLTAVDKFRAWAATKDIQYVKHPATWLNAGCWDDELTTGEFNNGHRGSRPLQDDSKSASRAAARLADAARKGEFSFAPRPSLLPRKSDDDVFLLPKG